jgi:opacity protein-like surface antigen
MKCLVHTVLICLILNAGSVSIAQDWTGNINLFLGAKALEKDDWKTFEVEEQTQFGILVDIGKTGWPVNVSMDLLASQTTESTPLADFEAGTTEFNLGIRRAFGDVVRPYVGGGVAAVSATLKGSSLGISYSDNDTAIGLWVNGGVYLTIGNTFNVGLDLRYSTAKATLFDSDFRIGGVHVGLALGYHW